jgi:hypothetical protein
MLSRYRTAKLSAAPVFQKNWSVADQDEGDPLIKYN